MMTRMMFALSLGFAALIHATQSVHAQTGPAQTGPACAARQMVVETLARDYGETRRSIGMASNNTVMELYASTETGSWTIAVTMPDGVTCLMASGQGFETIAEELPARGDPA